MRPQPEATAKKPYQQPKLLIYGNLTEMTLASSNKGNADGATSGSFRMRKTGK
jgi:hypothetical protein